MRPLLVMLEDVIDPTLIFGVPDRFAALVAVAAFPEQDEDVRAFPEQDAAVVAVVALPVQDAAVVAVAAFPVHDAAVVAVVALPDRLPLKDVA